MSRALSLSLAVAGSMILAGAAVSSGAIISDFEAPTYTTGSDIRTIDGWVGTGATIGKVYPDAGSGYVPPSYPVLSGAQSYVFYSGTWRARPFGSAAPDVVEGSTISAIVRVQSSSASAFYFSRNAVGGSQTAGIEFNKTTTNLDIWSSGGSSSTSFAYAPTTNYLVELTLHFTTATFDAYVTDLTNSGPRTLLTSGASFYGGALTESAAQANGGVMLIHNSGGELYVDDIQVNTVPEPAVLGLLGLGGLMLLRRRK